MSDHPINAILETSIAKIKELVNTNTVIGEPITFGSGTTAVPICKVTVGFGSGGADIPTSKPGEHFGGGTGAGISVTPIAFLVSSADGNVRVMQLDTIGSTADNIVRSVPDVLDKISAIIPKKNK